MQTIEKMLFEQQRFQIWQTARSEGFTGYLPAEYVLAWMVGVYPIDHGAATFHEPYRHLFMVTAPMMESLTELISSHWAGAEPLSFREIEKQLIDKDGIWDRRKLIKACRYLRLCDSVAEVHGDGALWESLVSGSDSPSEARAILRELDLGNDLGAF